MNGHRKIEIDQSTSRNKIDEFLLGVANLDKSNGKKHFRAVEKTIYLNGKPCRVTKLFVRSGRETPIEWFKNTFDSKRQYRLADETLKDHLKDVAGNSSASFGKGTTIGAVHKLLVSTSVRYKEKEIPAPAQKRALSEPTANRIAHTNRTLSVHNDIGEFLGIEACEKEEFKKDFKSFTHLARQCAKRNFPDPDFLRLNLGQGNRYALFTNAATISLRWARCWTQNPNVHNAVRNPRLAEIDRFVIWMAKHYLSHHVDYRELEFLSR